MAYSFRYRLQQAPQARNDGSGCVDHDIYAIASEDGETWELVPGRHKTISIPFAELDDALDQPTNPLRIAAYKDVLASNLNTAPVPITGWTAGQLTLLMEANDSAEATGAAVNTFITVTLGLAYPVDFSI